jgi:hypothetical protein
MPAAHSKGVLSHRGKRAVTLLAVALVVMAATLVSAQFGRGRFGIRMAPAELPDRSFTICRLMYQSVRREADGAGWQTDYPDGDNNLLTRFSELTRTPVSKDGRRPNHYVVRITDPALYNCPYTVASDVGTMGLRTEEVLALRQYLLKGGFLWVDDFWGTLAWEHWSRVIGEVLPGRPIEDVALSDPIFHTQFVVNKMPQVPRYPFWVGTGGQTSERGDDSREPHFRAIRDDKGRIIVVMTHNTDMGDSWEREAEEPAYFQKFSVAGYALGVDVLLYALTH